MHRAPNANVLHVKSIAYRAKLLRRYCTWYYIMDDRFPCGSAIRNATDNPFLLKEYGCLSDASNFIRRWFNNRCPNIFFCLLLFVQQSWKLLPCSGPPSESNLVSCDCSMIPADCRKGCLSSTAGATQQTLPGYGPGDTKQWHERAMHKRWETEHRPTVQEKAGWEEGNTDKKLSKHSGMSTCSVLPYRFLLWLSRGPSLSLIEMH